MFACEELLKRALSSIKYQERVEADINSEFISSILRSGD
jgi:hypothetical protein